VTLEELVSMIGPFLQRETNRSSALTEKELLQVTLHWLGTEQYHSVDDVNGVSKACVGGAAVHEVLPAVTRILLPQWV
jgi:hypothetical protein